MTQNQSQLQRDLRRLFRNMDFVLRHPAMKRDTKQARRFTEIHQPLGWSLIGAIV